MESRVRRQGGLQTPWLVVQSDKDEVIDVQGNQRFFEANARDPRSALVNYYSDRPQGEPGARVTWLPAAHAQFRVVGLSHLALHISPVNPHYGASGTYRNCGSTPFRREDEVRACRQATRLWYGAGGQTPPAGEAGARSTFNPHYPNLERRIGAFLNSVGGTAHAGTAPATGNR